MQYRFLVKIFWHTIKRSIKCHAIAMLLQWVYVLIYICSYIKCYCSTVRGDAKLSLKNPIPQYIWNMPQYHQIQYFKNNWAILLFHVSLVENTNCQNMTVFDRCFSFQVLPAWYVSLITWPYFFKSQKILNCGSLLPNNWFPQKWMKI